MRGSLPFRSRIKRSFKRPACFFKKRKIRLKHDDKTEIVGIKWIKNTLKVKLRGNKNVCSFRFFRETDFLIQSNDRGFWKLMFQDVYCGAIVRSALVVDAQDAFFLFEGFKNCLDGCA